MEQSHGLMLETNNKKRKKGTGLLALIGMGACCGGYAAILPIFLGLGGLGIVTSGSLLIGGLWILGAAWMLKRNKKNQERQCDINPTIMNE